MNKLQSLIESGLVDREDGTVLDIKNNLLWQQSPPEGIYTWKEANEYCKSLTLAGYSDWRLPTIEELKTLINKKYVSTIDPIFKCESSYHWSSSTQVVDTQIEKFNNSTVVPAIVFTPCNAWYVSFCDGYVSINLKDSTYFVRAVCSVKEQCV